MIHSLDKSVRFWRIIIGPWLFIFIHICYDRWEMIDIALKDRDIKKIDIEEIINFYK